MSTTINSDDPCQPVKGERGKAFAAFRLFRDAPPATRCVEDVAETLRKHRPSGTRYRRKQEHDQVSNWAQRYSWKSRAEVFDRLMDDAIQARQKTHKNKVISQQLAQINAALNQVESSLHAARILWADPARVLELNSLSALDILELASQSAAILPQLQAVKRLVMTGPNATLCHEDKDDA
jgi:hypothetical protein